MNIFFNQSKLHTLLVLLVLFLPLQTISASELQSLENFSQSAQLRDNPQQFALLIRHALAPGAGDPAEFSLDDCSTQRNLDDTGRQQAGKIGRLLRQSGFDRLSLFSSQWCRCRETAMLLAEGWKENLPAPKASDFPATDFSATDLPVVDLPIINSFFQAFEKREKQTGDLRQWLLKRSQSSQQDSVAVLITHQVNITALTNVYPSSGEIVIVRASDGKIEVVGSLETL